MYMLYYQPASAGQEWHPICYGRQLARLEVMATRLRTRLGLTVWITHVLLAA